MAHAGNNSNGIDIEKHGTMQGGKDLPVKWMKTDCVLRCLGFVLTLSASIIMATNKQTINILGIELAAIYHDTPAFVYFVVANAIGCAYFFTSLLLYILYMSKPGRPRSIRQILFFLDIIMFGLLLSAASSGSTVAYVGFKGDSHVNWNAICGVLDKFCHQGVGAAVASFLAVLTFLPLIVLRVYGSIN